MALGKEIYLYEELKEYINTYGYKSYNKQNLKCAGKYEALNANLSDMYSEAKKITVANTFIEFIFKYIDCGIKGRANLEFWLNNTNLADVYYLLIDKIKVILKEGLIREADLYKIGRELSIQSRNVNEIKLGLTLLRLCNNEESKDIFNVFSIHNEYTFYCLEGIKEYRGSNVFIFNLAKISRGYGKFMAVSKLEPLTEEIKIWLIEHGSDNDFLEEEILNIILNKICIEWYVNNTKSTLRKFNVLAKILNRIYSNEIIGETYYDYDLFYNYIIKFSKYGKRFTHIYALIAIISFINNKSMVALIEGESVYKEVVKETNVLEREISNILKDDSIIKVIKEEIKRDKESIDNILEVAIVIEDKLSFQDILPILEKQPLNLNIYRYITKKGDKESKDKIMNFIESIVCVEDEEEKLRDNILRYIKGSIEIKDIVREDLSEISVEPDVKDIFLITTNIEELEYRNMNKIIDLIYPGYLVYLIPDEEKLYDDNAIKVIAEDGWSFGYISRRDNYILRRLLEGEKKLYGIIEEINKEDSEFKVSVYLSRKDIEDEVNDILKMILVESTGLLN